MCARVSGGVGGIQSTGTCKCVCGIRKIPGCERGERRRLEGEGRWVCEHVLPGTRTARKRVEGRRGEGERVGGREGADCVCAKYCVWHMHWPGPGLYGPSWHVHATRPGGGDGLFVCVCARACTHAHTHAHQHTHTDTHKAIRAERARKQCGGGGGWT